MAYPTIFKNQTNALHKTMKTKHEIFYCLPVITAGRFSYTHDQIVCLEPNTCINAAQS